jgi:hypothetical protein
MNEVRSENRSKILSEAVLFLPNMKQTFYCMTHWAFWRPLKQSRYTPWRRLWGEEVYLLLIHDLGTRWGWVVNITPRPRFTPGERTPGTHWTGGWVDPRAGLDTEARGKILCPCRGSNPDRPVVQSVVRHYTAWATRLLNLYHIKNTGCIHYGMWWL